MAPSEIGMVSDLIVFKLYRKIYLSALARSELIMNQAKII